MTMNFALLLHKLLNSLIQSSHTKRSFPQGAQKLVLIERLND